MARQLLRFSVFCEKGYGACADGMARRVGVVKQTPYHYRGSKDCLFREALTGLVNVLLIDLGARSGSVREDLLRFAESFQAQSMSEQSLALYRRLVAESPRFPELARAVYESWQLAGVELARLLREAMQRGELRQEDPDRAVDGLISLLTGTRGDLHLFGMASTCPQQPGRNAQTVECFFAGLRTPCGGPGALKENLHEIIYLPFRLRRGDVDRSAQRLRQVRCA